MATGESRHAGLNWPAFISSTRTFVSALSFFKASLGLVAGIDLISTGRLDGRFALYGLEALVFTVAGVVLQIGNRKDQRASNLGVFFVLAANAFCKPLISVVGPNSPLVDLSHLSFTIEPESFLPFFLALFASEFPLTYNYRPGDRLAHTNIKISWVAGWILFLANAAFTFSFFRGIPLLLVLQERGYRQGYYFWGSLTLLLVPSSILAIRKTTRAYTVEQRRVRLFVAAFVVGIAPLVLAVLVAWLNPTMGTFSFSSGHFWPVGFIVYAGLLSVPVTTTYSVLVHRVLDVRLVVRAALQYTLARYSILVLSALPVSALAFYMYRNRNETLAILLSGPQAIAVFLTTCSGVLALRFRQNALTAIDRRFFREEYDAHLILESLILQMREAKTVAELVGLAASEIDLAFHVEAVSILELDSARAEFRSVVRSVPPLNAVSSLALVFQSNEPLEVDPEPPDSIFYEFPPEDRQWIIDTKTRLIVPIVGSGKNTIGLIILGAKKSELPFSSQDRRLLVSIASSIAMAFENRIPAATPAVEGSPEMMQVNSACCDQCGRVSASDTGACALCGGNLSRLPVPQFVSGKFRIVRRVGAGGMGVVYQAEDLSLGRIVAVKTLPRRSPEEALRLHREARAVASITHPNLATIYGVETWQGVPMLILEYVEKGTLADRIRRKDLTFEEILRIGVIVSQALEATHKAGILHRDIKPSNIGFAKGSIPKLMDFGLAKLISDQVPKTAFTLADKQSDPSSQTTVVSTILASDGYLIGTPPYISPDVVRGDAPDTQSDVWALTITLFEAIAGQNPFAGKNVAETLNSLATKPVASIREFRPDCPQPIAAFFDRALSPNKKNRPATASELTLELTSLQASLP